jgi:polar amino acid transport system substrate-binding protein
MKKIWKISSLLLIITSLALFFSACQKNEGDSDKTFIASGHPAWSPIMYQEGDSVVGAGVEITTKVFDELGIKINSRYVGGWDLVQDKARTGDIDVIVAAYKTAERETYMDYSVPYTIDPVSIFVKKGETFTFETWSDLVAKQGVVTKGDSYGQDFDNFIKDSLGVTIVDTPKEAFDMLINNQADYVVYALYSGEALIENENLEEQIEILPSYVTSENFYMTISKKSKLVQYLPQINELLDKYKADGTIDQIIQKYRNK